MNGENIVAVLTEDLDEEILKRMPLWLRIVKKAHARQVCTPNT